MKKEQGYLQFYMDCMNARELPQRGLCWSIGGPVQSVMDPTYYVFTNSELALFEPTERDQDTYAHARRNYWACEDENYSMFAFTPLRQTIVLFLAAMNNEL